jgi:hypothetical protein
MSIIQSVLFNKHLNSERDCLKWLIKHDLKYYKVDETENYFRWRQTDPKKNRAYRIKTVNEKKQIKFVIEYKPNEITPYKHNYGRRI